MITLVDYHDYLDYHVLSSDKYLWVNMLPINCR